MSATLQASATIEPPTAFPMEPRGPLSERLMEILSAAPLDHPRLDLADIVGAALAATDVIAYDDDIQVSLFILYGLHYGSFDAVSPEWEWHPSLIVARDRLERAFEAQLRSTIDVPELPEPSVREVATPSPR